MKELTQRAFDDIAQRHGAPMWVETLDIELPQGFVPTETELGFLYLAPSGRYRILVTNSGSNCTLAGKTYFSVPYKRDNVEDANENYGMVTSRITIGDTGGTVYALMTRTGGLSGLNARLGFAMPMDEDGETVELYPHEVVYHFVTGASMHDMTHYTLDLTNESPMRWRFPQRTMIKAFCQWVFRSPECGYTGADASCSKTIGDCRNKGNIHRIGCFPGCGSGGLAQ